MDFGMFVTREKINAGWSADRKYRVTDAAGSAYLLRITDAAQYETKKTEYEMMRQVAALGVPMCRPIAFSLTQEGVCAVHEWIDGEDLETVLPEMTREAQYRYGVQAGQYLKTMHTIPAPEKQECWSSRFNRKIDRKIRMYEDCPLKYEGGVAFLDYLAENRYLLSDRPQTFQHGDYHVGNMMLDQDGCLRIIDFNRADFGDPWEEFNRIVWCAQCSPTFATGMVNGYFDNTVPLQFWQLLALYISSNTLSSLPWAIPFGDTEIATMRRQAAEILCWYDNMRNPIPTWYDSALT